MDNNVEIFEIFKESIKREFCQVFEGQENLTYRENNAHMELSLALQKMAWSNYTTVMDMIVVYNTLLYAVEIIANKQNKKMHCRTPFRDYDLVVDMYDPKVFAEIGEWFSLVKQLITE